MSFWTDFRDALLAPINGTIDFVDDIVHGRPFDQALGNLVVHAVGQVDALTQAALQTDIGRKINTSPVLSSLTAGFSTDIQNAVDFEHKVNSGQEFTFSQARDAYASELAATGKALAAVYSFGTANAAAAAGGAGYYAAAGAGVTGALAGAGAVRGIQSGIQTGDFGSIITGIAGAATTTGLATSLAIPQGINDAVSDAQAAAAAAAGVYNDVKNATDKANQAASGAASLLDLVKSNTPAVVSGYSSNSPFALPGSSDPIMKYGTYAAVGIAAYIILLKGKK